MRLETAEAAPPLEPPVVLLVSQGFLVGPNSVGSVVTIRPYSGVADFPHITAPVSLNCLVR